MGRHLFLLGAALVVSAAAPDPEAFARKCRAGAPIATCTCVIEKLQRTKDGQITLEVFSVMEMPKDQQQALMIELANKYEMTMTGIKKAIDNSAAAIDTEIKSCL